LTVFGFAAPPNTIPAPVGCEGLVCIRKSDVEAAEEGSGGLVAVVVESMENNESFVGLLSVFVCVSVIVATDADAGTGTGTGTDGGTGTVDIDVVVARKLNEELTDGVVSEAGSLEEEVPEEFSSFVSLFVFSA
jgi:hypothetical protein